MKLKICVILIAACFACSVRAAEDPVTLNFVNSDIQATLKAMGLIAGKNFVVDPRVKGTINIVSSHPVPREFVYPILLSALRQQGFTAIDNGAVVKIIPEAEAKQQGTLVAGSPVKSGGGDRYLTQVYPLKFESAAHLLNTLRPLVGPNSMISVHQPGNTLLITDYAGNLARLNRIIDSIDQPPHSEFFTIHLQHASVLDIAQALSKLMPELLVQGVSVTTQGSSMQGLPSIQNQPAPTPPGMEGVRRTIVFPDVRNNQLLIRSEAAVHKQQIQQLVNTLDLPTATGSNINVVYLRNAEAVRLATTLKGILSGQGGDASVASNNNSNFSGNNKNTPTGINPSTIPAGVSANIQVAGVAVLIQADPITNALIITAPDHIYRNLRQVIDKLDRRRAQIYVEAMIAEVNIDKSSEFGVQWLVGGAKPHWGGGVVSDISTKGNTTRSNSIGSLATAAITKTPYIPNGFNIGILNGDPRNKGAMPTLGALVSALQVSGDANILSTPNLLTLDNETATIMVGRDIPIVTGASSTGGSDGKNNTPFNTFSRKEVGIKMNIKPQISEGGVITLSVFQEVSDIDSTVTNSQGGGYVVKKRTIDTKVLVEDGQTIILGGLIEDNAEHRENKIPILGSIPLLGELFRYRDRSWGKKNLMVFLRPVILHDGDETNVLSTERYQYLRAQQMGFAAPFSLVLPALPSVQLPELLPSKPVTAKIQSGSTPLAEPAASVVQPHPTQSESTVNSSESAQSAELVPNQAPNQKPVFPTIKKLEIEDNHESVGESVNNEQTTD